MDPQLIVRKASKIEMDVLEDTTALLHEALLEAIKRESGEQADKVEQLLQMSKDAHASNSTQALSTLVDALDPKELATVAAAFNMMLTLENLAEDVSVRARAEDAAEEGVDPLMGVTADTIEKLLAGGDWGKPKAKEAVVAALEQINFDIVFTAHPTQVMRKSLLQKCQEIRNLLHDLGTSRMTPHDQEEHKEKLKMLIHTCWRTDELRRKPPTPEEEMRSNLSFVRMSIFPAVPVFLKRLSKMCVKAGLPEYPLNKTPFKFSSWMGGDRDGNPNVTAAVTRNVVLTLRIEVLTMYIDEVQKLMFDLSTWRATPEFLAQLDISADRFLKHFGDKAAITTMRRRRGYDSFFAPLAKNEPYRKILAEVRDRLWDTRAALTAWLTDGGEMPDSLRPRQPGHNGLASEEYEGPYTSKDELLQPLLAIRSSLLACGDGIIADARLTDLIRQVTCFGLSFMALDVRQESTRHADAMDAVTKMLGLGSYASWSEAEKVQFLEKELNSKRPLIPASIMKEVCSDKTGICNANPVTNERLPSELNDEVREVLATFATIAKLPLDSFGTYVISMAQSASDVLCVRLFQKEFGVKEPMLRVAPLFETLDDLNNAADSLRTLFSCGEYKENHIVGGVQEVMIGYSDSGKDAGRLAAAWAQYETQEKLVAVAKDFGIDLVFFHGRGGTVGRGGGPVQLAVRAQPAGTIQKGRMRVTVQGEVIERQFGEKGKCCGTLDAYLSAMLEAELRDPSPVKPEWRSLMTELQSTSCEAYRQVVFRDPRFVEYFRDVTPSAELGRANIGSRPAKRKAVDSVGSIRAIPWIFAWTQTRFNLPVWLGVGDAISAANKNPAHKEVLKDMYQNFIFFRTVIDLLEMVFAKSDPDIAMLYDAKLATSQELKSMGSALRQNFMETRDAILNLAGHDDVLHGSKQEVNVPEKCKDRKISSDARLKRHIDFRSVFITPLNLMQVRCLLETRLAAKTGATSQPVQTTACMTARSDLALMEDALLLSVKGIAAGLQNTG